MGIRCVFPKLRMLIIKEMILRIKEFIMADKY